MNTNLIRDTNNQALHPEFQALAQRRREESPMSVENLNYLIEVFDWSDTPEGYCFWSRVYEACATETDLVIAIEANRGYRTHDASIVGETPQPIPLKPKKHSTMEDVFAGMNRHAKKEDNTKKEKLTEKDKKLLEELESPSELTEADRRTYRAWDRIGTEG